MPTINWRKWAYDKLHPVEYYLLVRSRTVGEEKIAYWTFFTDVVEANRAARNAVRNDTLIFFGLYRIQAEYYIGKNWKTYAAKPHLIQGKVLTHVTQAAHRAGIRAAEEKPAKRKGKE